MNKNLVIVFVKNNDLGKVKTRLAKTIGNEAALEVYNALVEITENATKNLDATLRIYFSNAIESSYWKQHHKAVQKGNDLGERMKNAFRDGFNDGFERIVLIGSDLPDMSSEIITSGLNTLKHSETVFGPAEDGGYYLLGMSKPNSKIFENKPWSKSNLLKLTLSELDENNISYSLLNTLNDIDTFEDLIASDFYKNNLILQDKIKQLQ